MSNLAMVAHGPDQFGKLGVSGFGGGFVRVLVAGPGGFPNSAIGGVALRVKRWSR